MAVVAGLFDSQDAATEAMDIILRKDYKDLDTRVIEGHGRYGDPAGQGPTLVTPVVPNTGNNMGSTGAAIVPGGADFDWLDDLDEVERTFYYEGIREGATLALARVDDDHADELRRIFAQHGARTYMED